MNLVPNPQGKGLVPLLRFLEQSRAAGQLSPKQIDQVSNELFTSLFILKSEFQFRPIIGKRYWLYRIDDKLKLLQLGPDEWSAGHPGKFIGKCILQEDITWTLDLDNNAAHDESLVRLIAEQRKQLQHALEGAKSLEDILPVYVTSLPFYRRVTAYGLAASLRISMQRAGINLLSYVEAKGLLTNHPA